MGDENNLENIDDLVRQAQGGDEESLGRLFELLSDRIYRYIIMRVSHRETAEDLTQTVFVEMIRSLPRYKLRAGAKFTTWLFQIARHRLIDHYRRQKIVIPLDETLDAHPSLQADPAPLEDQVLHDRLKELAGSLSERQQTIIHLFYREEMSIGEIADILQISALSVRVEKHRALTILKRLLSDGDADRTYL